MNASPSYTDMKPLDNYVDRLSQIRWGMAADWNLTARDLIFEYYRRSLPHWPEDRMFIFPHDQRFTDFYKATDPVYVDYVARWVLETHLANAPVSYIAKSLISLIIGCGLSLVFEELSVADNPAEPLLRFFEAGFDLNLNHNALDMIYAKGMVTVKLPSRTAIMAWTPMALD